MHFRPDRIAWGWMPAHPALFVKREVFQKAGPFRTDYRIAGDFEFVARAFGKQSLRYRYLPEVLVKMRLGDVSTGGWRNTMLLNKEVLRVLCWLMLPLHVLLNLGSIVWFTFRGSGQEILRAKRDALLGLPKMWRKRQEIQKHRVVSVGAIWRVLDKHMFRGRRN